MTQVPIGGMTARCLWWTAPIVGLVAGLLVYLRNHRPWRPECVYHLHIPKTAGSSLAVDLAELLLERGGRVISNEGCFRWGDATPSAYDCSFKGTVLMFRSPRAHVLSQYQQCKSAPYRPSRYRGAMPSTFQAWLRAWMDLRAGGRARGDFAPGLALAPLKYTRLPFQCYSPVDLQTQHMTCGQPHLYPDVPNLSMALHNVRTAWSVGLVEHYQESICLLYERVQGSLPRWCACEDEESWGAAPLRRLNALADAPDRGAPDTRRSDNFTEETLQMADALTGSDRALYAAARERFLADVRRLERRRGTRVLCSETVREI